MTILLPNKTLISLSILCLLSASQASYSGILNNGAWQVQPGDSLYGIARQVHPGDKTQQKLFRQQLLKLNQQHFAQGADFLSVGTTLTLPASPPTQVAEKKPLVKPAKKPVLKAPVAIVKTAPVKPEPFIAKVQPANDSIGKIVINIGTLNAVNNGKTRLLKRHSEIRQGDTLKTAANTHTQIRFKDGALISLKPETEFHIAQYNYDGAEDGTERGIFELIKGGFRTITGAIGHKNKQNYQVKTAVATIGIRGTHYGLMLCATGSCQGNNDMADGLYGGVVDGSVVIDNQSGQHKFNNDQYFHLASAGSAPVEQLLPPPIFNQESAPVAEGEAKKDEDMASQQFVSDETNEQRPRKKPPVVNLPPPPSINPSPIQIVQALDPAIQNLPRLAPNGSGMLLAFDHGLNTPDPFSNEYGVAASVVVLPTNNNQILLHDYIAQDGRVISNIPLGGHELSLTDGKSHDLALRRPDGTGAVIVPSSLGGSPIGVNWGRWRGDYVVLENGKPIPHTADMHFIYSDKLTKMNDPATIAYLKGLGSNVTYTTDTIGGGGTLPTDRQGNVGANIASATMTIDHFNQKMKDYSVSATVNGKTYQGIRTSTTPVALTQLHEGFKFDAGSGSGCITACEGSASVAFVGAGAEGAMTSYKIDDPSGAGGVSGVGLMRR